jgi:cytochrome c-type biogenesis protein CcmF
VTQAGHILLIAALAALVAAVAALASGFARRRDRDLQVGLWLVGASCAAVVIGAAILVRALLSGDTSFAYVLENWHPSLSAAYRVAAFWAGAQGSLLLWVVLLLLATVVVAARSGAAAAARAARRPGRAAAPAGRVDHLGAGAVLVLAAVAIFLVSLMVFDASSDPFAVAPVPAPPPAGLNPLLLHPAMALHPPALFIGYVGLVVPFAFALSALAGGRLDTGWTLRSRGWALGGWIFLSLGIGLGAWWAYVILSWGGYWGWDPVENTSLIPWLTATALLHSFAVYRRAPVFRRWAVALAALTFWFTMLATWTTRSGVVASVHAFEKRTLLVVVLSLLLGVVAAVSVALIARRWRQVGAGSSPGLRDLGEGLGGARDVMHELTNVALTAFAAAIAFATVVVPLVMGQTVRAGTYDALARPLGVIVMVGLGLCPLLGRAREGWRAVVVRALPPVIAAAVTLALLAAFGWAHSLGGMVGLSACAFAGVAALEWLWIRAQRAGGDDGVMVGVSRAITGSRGATGGMLVHVGMAILMAGLIGSGIYQQRAQLDLKSGTAAAGNIGDYRIRVLDVVDSKISQGGQRVTARLAVERGGSRVGVAEPSLDFYPDSGQTVARAAIVGQTWQDLFISPESFSEKTITVQAIVFPLIRLVWIGAGFLVIGGAVAMLPRRRRAEATAPVRAAAERGR